MNQEISPKIKAQWYIITSTTGNEDTVYKNIEDKVRAYGLQAYVQEMRLLKSREITIEVFDPINNPAPSRMVNTKFITWEALPGNRYKKTRVREVNRFPGYIYIKMVMNPNAWYVIRNTYGVTGFVGSSGKGALPIPMSDLEISNLFDPANNVDIVINKNADLYVDQSIEQPELEEKKVEFLADTKLSDKYNQDGFYDSQYNKNEAGINKSFNDLLQEKMKGEPGENMIATYLDEHKESDNAPGADWQNKLAAAESNQTLQTDLVAGNAVVIHQKDGGLQGLKGHILEIDYQNQTADVLVDELGFDTPQTFLLSELKKDL